MAGLTENEVRNKLEEDEASEAAAGRPALHEVGPTEFIVAGLDLEDEYVDLCGRKFGTHSVL